MSFLLTQFVKPRLHSMKLKGVSDTASDIEIIYIIGDKPEGIELMGMDAGLDWIPGDSKMLAYIGERDKEYMYGLTLNLSGSCEFRARAFDGVTDFWEDGSNHSLIRKMDGRFNLKTDSMTIDQVEIINRIPVNLNVSETIAKIHVENIADAGIDLFQILVEIAIWVDDLLVNPIDNIKLLKIPDLVRYLKTELRNYDSMKVNDIVRSTYLYLTKISVLIATFHEDDDRILTGSIEKEGYLEFFRSLAENVKKLENEGFGDAEDSYALFKEHMKYI